MHRLYCLVLSFRTKKNGQKGHISNTAIWKRNKMGYRISITLLVKLNCSYPAGPYYQSNRGFNQKTFKRKACLHQTDLNRELKISEILFWQMASPCSIAQIGEKKSKNYDKKLRLTSLTDGQIRKSRNKKMHFL